MPSSNIASLVRMAREEGRQEAAARIRELERAVVVLFEQFDQEADDEAWDDWMIELGSQGLGHLVPALCDCRAARTEPGALAQPRQGQEE